MLNITQFRNFRKTITTIVFETCILRSRFKNNRFRVHILIHISVFVLVLMERRVKSYFSPTLGRRI